MASNRTYKIRRFTNGQSQEGVKFTNYSLTVPASIAEKLAPEMQFECEMTDAGILFRPVTAEVVELPAWAQAAADESPAAPRNGARKRAARQTA